MKKDMRSQFNEMIVLSEDKKVKKGNGINAVLKLMSETIDFSDKISACIEDRE